MKVKMSEEQFARQVIELATVYGWRVFRVENSTREITRRSGARVRVRNINATGVGYPDLTLVRAKDRRLLFVELKRDLGPRGGGIHSHVQPTDEQLAWMADLRAAATRRDQCGRADHAAFDVHLWRPSDFARVEEWLR